MKRMLVLLLICLTVSFSACSSFNNNRTTSNELSATSMNESATPDIDKSEPPYTLRFNSFEEIAALKNIVNQNEEVVKNYLADKEYDMNGNIVSTEDIKALFDRIGDINMLHITKDSGYELVEVIYYIDYGYILTTYRQEKSLIRFYCYLESDNYEETSSDSLVDTLLISEKTMNIYKVKDELSSNILKGRIRTNNSVINMCIIESEDEDYLLEEVKSNIILAPLSNLVKE